MINNGELFSFLFCFLLGKSEKVVGGAPPYLNVWNIGKEER